MVRDIDFSEYRTRDWSMLLRARIATLTLGAVVLPLAGHGVARAQAAAATTTASAGPAVNDVAPDFSLAGADRYGLLKTPVRLSDFRGRTVVLAFFYQARTKG
jgi:hypothetical protein